MMSHENHSEGSGGGNGEEVEMGNIRSTEMGKSVGYRLTSTFHVWAMELYKIHSYNFYNLIPKIVCGIYIFVTFILWWGNSSEK